jgi:transcriptional regulator with XRE-family HTH domain
MDHRELWRAHGEAIRSRRLQLKLSQLQLALQAGVSPRSVMKAERGGLLFPSTLVLIAAALGGSLDEYRLREEPLASVSRRADDQIAVARRTYDAYNHFVLARDVDCLMQEMVREMKPGILWSSATSDGQELNGVYQGREGVTHFLEEGLEISSRDRAMLVEEIRPIGYDRLLVRCADRIYVRPFGGIISTSEVHLITFEDGQMAQFHQSVQILNVTPVSGV